MSQSRHGVDAHIKWSKLRYPFLGESIHVAVIIVYVDGVNGVFMVGDPFDDEVSCRLLLLLLCCFRSIVEKQSMAFSSSFNTMSCECSSPTFALLLGEFLKRFIFLERRACWQEIVDSYVWAVYREEYRSRWRECCFSVAWGSWMEVIDLIHLPPPFSAI